MSRESINLYVKQPIKRLEIPISKFDVAISHHLDLLQRHKNNIKKFEKIKDWNKVHKEQINASRLVKQLEQLVYEMDTLRGQVKNEDIEKFDKLTWQSRCSTINAIQEYLEMELASDPPETTEKKFKDESQINEPTDDDDSSNNDQDNQLLQVEKELEELERKKSCLNTWNLLQNDLHQLRQLFIDLNRLINDQKEDVNKVEDHVIIADENVNEGNKNLEKALKLKATAYPLAGALLGTCIGGPVGLIAGLKLGGLTAFGCGILGYAGATILKKNQLQKTKNVDTHEMTTSKTNFNSVSSKEPKKQL
ncbi:syntaxin-17 [Chelonus insularis]|uniref:syntaxin-17 n=1 Tax=Chelonus insularis TaxID=460826 RepID=UPI00158D09DD|nr:syntaxin-17 [Chelonus insularis]